MHSYQRPTSDGWRWSPGWRTRQLGRDTSPASNAGSWIVQRWTGPDGWETTNYANTYAEAREIPDAWRREKEKTR